MPKTVKILLLTALSVLAVLILKDTFRSKNTNQTEIFQTLNTANEDLDMIDVDLLDQEINSL